MWLRIPKYGVRLCRVRKISHYLEIERGGWVYTVPKTSPENRLCNQYEDNLVEDEIHFILICKKYLIIRHYLFSVVCNCIIGIIFFLLLINLNV